MSNVKFRSGETIPLEMHKARIVQKLNLPPADVRLEKMREAGFNTFLLKNRDVFLDMLTDSGTNAMSDKQFAAMMQADESYAGSETYFRLEAVLQEVFGMKYFLPAHQGRACEHIISRILVTPGTTALMNYHFTTTKAHITLMGGAVEEIIIDEGLKVKSELPFKGNMDIDKLKGEIKRLGKENICFVRIEAGTNLVGGQPVSMENIRETSRICRAEGIKLVFDASLLADNLYFIKTREKEFANVDIVEITREIGRLMDVIYFSARKLGSSRGGGILTSDDGMFSRMRELVPLYEGFMTYGGMSTRDMEATAVGLMETMDMDVISQTPIFVAALARELQAKGVPVVTPYGGLGCHIDAREFCEHITQEEYPAGALAAALYIASGVRGMERGTLSEQRNPDGSERLAEMELVRLAIPRRVFTLSQIQFVADRVAWLYENRKLIGGLKFTDEPKLLRFFIGKLDSIGGWPETLMKKFTEDFGDSL
ncbi:MAG: tryptophanase [Oscillospiraceae bacterium]|nr:tryptophanase [Oscillospiraceae bacterium]